MSSLSIIPIETLEWITSVVTTAEQMRLWICGDHILNIKLKYGGLKRTSLQWRSAPWMPWPRTFFAISTQLRDISWNDHSRPSLCPTLELNLLPTTLLRLQLDCEDVFCLLRQQTTKLNELLPCLHVLKLKGKRLSEENLKHFPPHLIELSVDSEQSRISSRVLFRDLPIKIEQLVLKFHLEDLGKFGNDLPTALKKLHISSLEAKFNWFAKLPRSLMSLIIGKTFHLVPDWRSLPPQLEELSYDVDREYIEFGGVSPSILPILPLNLKSLSLVVDTSLSDSTIELFPRKLTTLVSKNRSRFTHIGLKDYPPSLTDCDLFVEVNHPDLLSFYPLHTTQMILVFNSNSPKLSVPPLPQLSTLTIHSITDDICDILPPQLTALNVEGGSLTVKGATKLPKFLTDLCIHLQVFNANEVISQVGFIPNITFWCFGSDLKLDANWLSFLKSSCLSESDTEIKNSYTAYSESNSGHLDINLNPEGSGVSYLGETSFRSLSSFSHLSVLRLCSRLGKNAWIPAHYIQFVPASLTELDFGVLDRFPTPSDIATLPKRLSFLSIDIRNDKTCTWNDEELELLPRTLRTFHIQCYPCSFPNMTREMHLFLPPSLIEMNVNDETHHQFISPLDRLYPKNG